MGVRKITNTKVSEADVRYSEMRIVAGHRSQISTCVFAEETRKNRDMITKQVIQFHPFIARGFPSVSRNVATCLPSRGKRVPAN